MDVHLLASSGGEAFPNAVGETMLSGTPNIVTDVGDSALIVGDTGWVVPPSRPAAIATAIEHAWRERKERPVRWEERRLAARQRIIDNFTFDRMVAAYENVWREVLRT
jgi:glycosyltransferase involved in cell wall biosynthesis